MRVHRVPYPLLYLHQGYNGHDHDTRLAEWQGQVQPYRTVRAQRTVRLATRPVQQTVHTVRRSPPVHWKRHGLVHRAGTQASPGQDCQSVCIDNNGRVLPW
uniref:Uncharacterized protein n=1 Tax=Cacopsylla melanoneura TaxID=428564 RepID=A0A8D8ZLQ8_9HEMI